MSDVESIVLGAFHSAFITTQNVAGPVNADALPTWEVKDTSDGSVVYSGDFGLDDGTTGEYSDLIEMSPGNGIVAGSTYRVLGRGDVGGVPFVIEEAKLSVAAAASSSSLGSMDVSGATIHDMIGDQITYLRAILAKIDSVLDGSGSFGVISYSIGGKTVTLAKPSDYIREGAELRNIIFRYAIGYRRRGGTIS